MKSQILLLSLFVVFAQSAILVAQTTSPAKTNVVQPASKWPNLNEVIVVVKTHFDIGYTHSVRDIVHYYRTGMIDLAMTNMDDSKSLPQEEQFSLTMPGWVAAKVLEDWPGQTPERKKLLDEYIKSGKFKYHALPFTLESDACEPEEMARGLGFASTLSRHYGLPLPIAGKMTDVPGHGGALETILAHGGVKFMHIGCNWPSGYVQTPGLFWWEGPDGSRTLTFYSSVYGTATGFNWSHEMGGGEPNVGYNFLPPNNWAHKVWPAILVTMDNSGPPKADDIKKLFDEFRKALPGVKIRFGTMDDFANAILATKPDLPVVKGEMPDTWIHGVMCDPRGVQSSRAVHPQLAAAEVLHTQLNLRGAAQPAIAKNVALAYEKILLYGEHTWGISPSVNQYGDAFKKADPKLVARLEASWEDKSDYIRDAAKISQAIADNNLKTLAAQVKAAPGDAIVYNPLPWSRSGEVALNGNNIFVRDVPPCGYKIIKAGKIDGTVKVEATTLESPFFKLTLDPATGSIASLVDKHTAREWVDAAAQARLGQYLNERFTYEQTLNYTMTYQMERMGKNAHRGMYKPGMISEMQVPYRAAFSGMGIVKTEAQSAIIECPADTFNHMPATALKITLDQNQPFIDLEITIKDKAKDNWPEADWLCLPFKIAAPMFRVYRQLGSMNPATDILNGANRDLFAVGNGVTITDADGAGIAICPIDHPLISLERPGCWKWSKSAEEFTPKKPVVYINLYNNQWNTNFRYWYSGTWSSRVRLWTFDKKTPVAAVMATPALEARNPLIAVFATGTGDKLPTEQAGIAVSRKGVLVTAFGANPDGDGTLLRVWEQAGISGELTVILPKGMKASLAQPVTLRGEKNDSPITIRNNRLTFKFDKYAPASFILK